MQPLAVDDEQVRFWERHLRIGVAITVAITGTVVLSSWLPVRAPHAVAQSVLSGVVDLVTFALLLVPVDRLVRHPRGRLFFDTWEGLGICGLSTFVAWDGGARSPLILFYFVLLAHAALAYPPTGMVIAGFANVGGFLVVALASDHVTASYLAVVTVCMTIATGTCALASYNHVQAYRRISRYARDVAVLASRDGLTGCLNRRAFHERLDAETARTTATGRPLALAVLDIDHFKGVNDAYGHLAGDHVLAEVGHALTEVCRAEDSPGRLGGDEFALLLPGADESEALRAAGRIAERLRTAMPFRVTVSFGVARVTGPTSTEELLSAADRAVYQAKRSGRDQVSLVVPAVPASGTPVGPAGAVPDQARRSTQSPQ